MTRDHAHLLRLQEHILLMGGGGVLETYAGEDETPTPDPEPEPGPLDVLNVQKLSLPIASPTDGTTRVSVSDGFYVTGFGDARDDFYFARGTSNGEPVFQSLASLANGDTGFSYDGTYWNSPSFVGGGGGVEAAPGSRPWDIGDWNGGLGFPLTFTHPALQQLNPPGGEGEAVAGLRIGSNTYVVNGTENSRNKYTDVLGVADDVLWDGSKWVKGATDVNLGDETYPWLGTPAISVIRDDVASETNWIAVP